MLARIVHLCLVVCLLVPAGAGAASLESLIMPGEVIEGHAKYEEECSKCHVLLSKQSQSRLCLDCHEKVDRDVQDGSGFHGRNGVDKQPCKECHTDHAGRDADIVPLNLETFDHGNTDFTLRGAHVNVACAGCHQPDKKYREASHDCFACHRTDDIHKGSLGEACDDCHDDRGWKKHDFDHDETDFKLRGKHADITCDSCHAGQRYEDTPTACNDCHRFNDVHAGRFGTECGDCHGVADWKRITFDHDRKTDYPLRGRHRKVACAACHEGGDFEKSLPDDCYSCHRDIDQHKGNYGKECESCHSEDGWHKAKFDHGKETDFPLRGKHDRIACTACHRGATEDEDLGKTCIDCHRQDDVHQGKEGEQCDSCHSESGWGERISFEHDFVRFPLLGLHAVVPCEECHLSAVFTEASTKCPDCHEPDDVHEKRLGPECAACHNPNGWALWDFDHNSRTSFELDGGHEGIQCEACHIKPMRGKVSASSRCDACHSKDDVHDGRFGRYCERCHNTTAFDQVSLR